MGNRKTRRGALATLRRDAAVKRKAASIKARKMAAELRTLTPEELTKIFGVEGVIGIDLL
jgi:hypothetical protein